MIRADAELNAGGFLSGLRSIDGAFGRVAGSAAAVSTVFAGFAAFFALFAGLKKTLDMGGELADLSANTGQSVKDLVVLRQAFQNAGVGADKTQDILGKFQAKLGGVDDESGSAAEALRKIGLTAEGLKSLSAVDQLTAMQKGFAGITDQAQKSQVATALFGRSGVKMGALLGDPQALATARAQTGSLGEIMERMAPLFDSISDGIGAIAIKFQQFGAGFMEFVGPVIEDFVGELSTIDLSGIGAFFGILAAGALKVISLLSPLLELVKGIIGTFNEGGKGGVRAFGEFLGLKTGNGASASAAAGLPVGGDGGGGGAAITSQLGRIGLGGGVSGDAVSGRIDRSNSILEQIRDTLRDGGRLSTALDPQPFPEV